MLILSYSVPQLVSPGAWLCDLTLERYEVREKKISKKVGENFNFENDDLKDVESKSKRKRKIKIATTRFSHLAL